MPVVGLLDPANAGHRFSDHVRAAARRRRIGRWRIRIKHAVRHLDAGVAGDVDAGLAAACFQRLDAGFATCRNRRCRGIGDDRRGGRQEERAERQRLLDFKPYLHLVLAKPVRAVGGEVELGIARSAGAWRGRFQGHPGMKVQLQIVANCAGRVRYRTAEGFAVVHSGERRGIGCALQLAFPQGPLDRVGGQARGADDQRHRRTGDRQRIAAAVSQQFSNEGDHRAPSFARFGRGFSAAQGKRSVQRYG